MERRRTEQQDIVSGSIVDTGDLDLQVSKNIESLFTAVNPNVVLEWSEETSERVRRVRSACISITNTMSQMLHVELQCLNLSPDNRLLFVPNDSRSNFYGTIRDNIIELAQWYQLQPDGKRWAEVLARLDEMVKQIMFGYVQEVK